MRLLVRKVKFSLTGKVKACHVKFKIVGITFEELKRDTPARHLAHHKICLPQAKIIAFLLCADTMSVYSYHYPLPQIL